MKSLKVAICIVILACAAFATTVTGTIVDANGNPYAAGTISAFSGVGNGTTPLALAGNGFFSMTLTAGTYLFTVCGTPANLGPRGNPAPTQTCFMSQPIAISGGTQDLSSTLNPLVPVLGPQPGEVTASFTATAALTAGQVVKVDTSNANAVLVATTSDTGGGVPIGIVINSPATAGNAIVLLAGPTALPLLGTSTCSLGQWAVVDTTTNGRIKCGTYTAGTSIGVVTQAQATVGSPVTILVQPR